MSSPNQLSFLPDDYLERKAQRRTNVICASLFLVVMSAVGTAFTVSERKTRDLDRQYEAKRSQVSAAARKIQQAEQMELKQRQMFRQAELSASLLEKVPRSYVLAEFTNSLPPGVSLMDLNLEAKVRASKATSALPVGATAFQQRQAEKAATDAAKKSGATPQSEAKQYDVALKVTGLAYTDVQVAQFIRKLNDSRMLKEVNLVISDQFAKDGESLRKFQIECTLDPEADVTAMSNRSSNSPTRSTFAATSSEK